MAVNVNTVYQRVLTIANKEQRGYITPQEFNILANQAQMDLFEQYFYDINQFSRIPGNSRQFSDMLHILEEKISALKVNGASLVAANASFSDDFQEDITSWSPVGGSNGSIDHVVPSSSNNYDGGLKILQSANSAVIEAESLTNFSLTAGKKYILSWSLIGMDEPSSYSVYIDDGGTVSRQMVVHEPAIGEFNFNFIADTTGAHNVRIENSDVSNGGKFITIGTISVKEVNDTTLPSDLYRLGSVLYKSPGETYPKVVAEVTANDATLFNFSPLARPTTTNPAYVRSSIDSITIHPSTLETSSTVTCNYIKIPDEVVWGHTTVSSVNSTSGITTKTSLYNSLTSTNFSLHESEEVNLVNRILVLAGITIKDNGLAAAAAQEEIKDIQQEKA